jgi:hypothetical protein
VTRISGAKKTNRKVTQLRHAYWSCLDYKVAWKHPLWGECYSIWLCTTILASPYCLTTKRGPLQKPECTEVVEVELYTVVNKYKCKLCIYLSLVGERSVWVYECCLQLVSVATEIPSSLGFRNPNSPKSLASVQGTSVVLQWIWCLEGLEYIFTSWEIECLVPGFFDLPPWCVEILAGYMSPLIFCMPVADVQTWLTGILFHVLKKKSSFQLLFEHL